MFASYKNHTEVMELLIEHNASLDIQVCTFLEISVNVFMIKIMFLLRMQGNLC